MAGNGEPRLDGVAILFLNNFAGPGIGGGETHLVNLARRCLDAGVDVHVMCQPGGDLERATRALGANVQALRFGAARLPWTLRSVRRYVSRNGVGSSTPVECSPTWSVGSPSSACRSGW